MSDEPHAIEDNEPPGEQTQTHSKKIRLSKKQIIIVAIGFDENLKEFELWDYLYDIETSYFGIEAVPDYKNRIQYYEITADRTSILKFRLWLKENEFKYKFDKI